MSKANLDNAIDTMASELFDVGAIDKVTLRGLREENLPEIHVYTPEEIQAVRSRLGLSQAVFAKYLNISKHTVQALEHGKSKARGSILKLLNIVDKNGLEVLA